MVVELVTQVVNFDLPVLSVPFGVLSAVFGNARTELLLAALELNVRVHLAKAVRAVGEVRLVEVNFEDSFV